MEVCGVSVNNMYPKLELIYKLNIDGWFYCKVSGVIVNSNMFTLTLNYSEKDLGYYVLDTMQSS